ncbi:hypothetical protein [Ensifer canadensis]
MTDIRKHGFDSDMQWREYLAEIEEAALKKPSDFSVDAAVLQELSLLRQEVAALRQRVEGVTPHQASRLWRPVGVGVVLVALLVASRLVNYARA